VTRGDRAITARSLSGGAARRCRFSGGFLKFR
jgi:hypothetical protein